jgi:phospholipid/cholesterol/gamma-HCH transport system ATP-binding protein
MMAENIIEIRKLWKVYDNFTVLQDVDLDVHRGEILSIVGGSGSGKTTLLRQMIGLEQPTKGSVRVFGELMDGTVDHHVEEARNRWGMLFQHGALFSSLTVFDNIALPLREMRALPEDLIRDLVMLKLDMVRLQPADANKMPADLSGGMVKRVALARALALEPELLFLDEPTAGLDPESCESFVSLIRTLQLALGLTIVMVTHDLDTLFELSTSVAVLAEKHVIINAPVKDVLALSHPFIQKFFLGERGQRAMAALDENVSSV